MLSTTRRAWLAALAGVAAGCNGTGNDGSPAATTTTTATSSTTTTSTTEPPAELRLRPVSVEEADGPMTVYPAELADWLRQAASTGETVREYAEVPAYNPVPVLPRFEMVELRGDDAVAGSYAVDAAGGPRYEHFVGAERVDEVPDGEEVTPVSDLPAERRTLAEAAIAEDQRARVYPETELGTWVRTEFYGGYFSHDGKRYRGHEVQQTDAAFFSQTVWYVLSLSPTDGDGTALRLVDVDPAVREVIDRVIGEDPTPVERSERGPFPAAVTSFAAETEFLLTHTAVYEVSLVQE